MHNFEKLEIWKRSCEFSSKIYSATNSFPKEEAFGLTNQLRRASISIPSNISEGCSRSSTKEFKRFLEISIGSCFEVTTQLIIAQKVGYLKTEVSSGLIREVKSIIEMTIKFKNRL